MENKQVKMVAIFVALENQEENLKKALLDVVEPSRKETSLIFIIFIVKFISANIEYDLH